MKLIQQKSKYHKGLFFIKLWIVSTGAGMFTRNQKADADTETAKNELITSNPYYESMGNSEKERQKNYRQFIAADEPYGNLVDEVLSLV